MRDESIHAAAAAADAAAADAAAAAAAATAAAAMSSNADIVQAQECNSSCNAALE